VREHRAATGLRDSQAMPANLARKIREKRLGVLSAVMRRGT
jgi:hypothetical protein